VGARCPDPGDLSEVEPGRSVVRAVGGKHVLVVYCASTSGPAGSAPLGYCGEQWRVFRGGILATLPASVTVSTPTVSASVRLCPCEGDSPRRSVSRTWTVPSPPVGFCPIRLKSVSFSGMGSSEPRQNSAAARSFAREHLISFIHRRMVVPSFPLSVLRRKMRCIAMREVRRGPAAVRDVSFCLLWGLRARTLGLRFDRRRKNTPRTTARVVWPPGVGRRAGPRRVVEDVLLVGSSEV